MTGQGQTFIKELIPVKRRWIKVGGVRLNSDFKGNLLLKSPDGSNGIFPDALLVKSLGVNLFPA